MKQLADRITRLEHGDLCWPFSDSGGPHLSLKTQPWANHQAVDPFPCYAHEDALVVAEVRDIEAKLALPFPPQYFILPFETGSRTNGWADGNRGHDREPSPFIVLSGKRIPLHPAMTRYLVAHEYGHVVQTNLIHFMKMKWEEFCEYYAREVRGIPYVSEYGGLKWHENTGEIIANDIRIGLLGKEPEFWPHSAVHPWGVPGVISWWRARVSEHFVPKPVEVAPTPSAAVEGA